VKKGKSSQTAYSKVQNKFELILNDYVKIILVSLKQAEFFFTSLFCPPFFHQTFSGFVGYHNIWRSRVAGLNVFES